MYLSLDTSESLDVLLSDHTVSPEVLPTPLVEPVPPPPLNVEDGVPLPPEDPLLLPNPNQPLQPPEPLQHSPKPLEVVVPTPCPLDPECCLLLPPHSYCVLLLNVVLGGYSQEHQRTPM